MSHSASASYHSQALPRSGAASIDEKIFPRESSPSFVTLVQTYHDGKRFKSDTIKRLTRLVIDELERASRAGDNIKEVSSLLSAYLEILNVFDKEGAGARQEDIVAREDWVGKVGQVSATQKRGIEDEGKPDHAAKQPIDLELIPFGRPDYAKLPDDLRLTHDLQDNYERDLACAKALLLRDPSRPEFPSNLWENVLSNTFVDFNQLFSQLIYPVDRKFSGPGDWAYTWDKYEKAVLFAFPHRELELRQYKEQIQELFLELPEELEKILQYDNRVRTRVADSGSLRLCDFPQFTSDLILIGIDA